MNDDKGNIQRLAAYHENNKEANQSDFLGEIEFFHIRTT